MAMSGGEEAYLYAIVAGPQGELPASGVFDRPVTGLPLGDFTAVISLIPHTEKLRPERRLLSAHEGVIEALLGTADAVLPAAFGTVAESPEAIGALFAPHLEELAAQASRVRRRAEMEVHVAWGVPDVYAFVVDRHPDLRELRDRLFAPGRTPTREEKIDLGQAFERAREAERAEVVRQAEERMAPFCAEVRSVPPWGDGEAARFSCLVDRDAVAGFGARLEDAVRGLGEELRFRYAGPFPPYTFVDLKL